MSTRQLSNIDASELPDAAFGHRDLMWWGTAGFILIEATTVLVCFASYFYLWRAESRWPPPPIPLPALAIPSVAVGVALLSIIPAAWSAREGRRMNSNGVRSALLLNCLFGLVLLVLRGYEFAGVGTRWYGTAYGSIVWMTLGVHTTLLFTDFADTLFVTLVFLMGREQTKHFVGLLDNAVYWYFVVASWLATYAVIFVAPRFL